MRILCNLPLECFDDRSTFGDVELVTFGPAQPRWIDGTLYPFDVTFDPSRGTVEELWAALPDGFAPDLLLIYWPDQEPLPDGLDRCPCRVVGILSDYNLSLPHVVGLWPQFDTLLVDTPGVELFQRLSFADTRAFCQFTFKRGSHFPMPEVVRDLDIAFAGNLNPAVQRERAAWLTRLQDLGRGGLAVETRSGIFGADYGRLLNRARIGFNRSIRGEMNLRAFEVPACGAVLLMEASNLEVRDFLVPDEEVVLYGDDDFEECARALAADRDRCARIAAAGQRRIEDFRMGRRLEALRDTLEAQGPSRTPSTPGERALGRGVAMLGTWAHGEPTIRALLEACRLMPDDPRPTHTLALAWLQADPVGHLERALELLRRAAAQDPDYLPARFNFAHLLRLVDHPSAARLTHEVVERLQDRPSWPQLDGLFLPLGFSAIAVDRTTALAAAIRAGTPEPFTGQLCRAASPVAGGDLAPLALVDGR